VVQADTYNQSQRHVIVAEITSNLTAATDPANLLIEVSTPDGQATGLAQDSVVTYLQLATISQDRVSRVIGELSPTLLQKLDDCLKAALGL
jgi:mRNA interferase MazF